VINVEKVSINPSREYCAANKIEEKYPQDTRHTRKNTVRRQIVMERLLPGFVLIRTGGFRASGFQPRVAGRSVMIISQSTFL
jgi:hypothetical protein